MKRIICVILAALLLLPFGVSVYASDTSDDDYGLEVRAFTEDEWFAMTSQQRNAYFNAVVKKNGGSAPTFSFDSRVGSYMAYKFYCDLYNGKLNAKMSLQWLGLVDFNLKIGNPPNHGGDGFGGHRKDIDEQFEEYEKDYPYAGVNDSICYKFSNGYYITWDYVMGGQYGMIFGMPDGSTHSKYTYQIRFYLHDESGKMVESCYNYDSGISCPSCFESAFHNFTILPNGRYGYDYENNGWVHHADWGYQEHTFPWYDRYGEGEEDEPTVIPVPITLYDIDTGDTINAFREGDNINYNNNYYNYGDTVTIGDNTYTTYYNFNNMPQNYQNDFYNYITNYYINNNYGNEIDFDDSEILSALGSIYSKLQAIFTKMNAGFNNVVKVLKDILKQLKDVNASLDDITEKDKEESKALWLELISDFKKKISYDDIETGINNIQTAFFAKRDFSTSDDGTLIVEIKDKNDVVTPSTLPNLSVTLFGQQYKLYGCVASLGAEIETIKGFIGLFLVVGFLIMLFRSAPGVIASATRLIGEPSNVSQVEAYRSKYD